MLEFMPFNDELARRNDFCVTQELAIGYFD
jgi:hypothetical protein